MMIVDGDVNEFEIDLSYHGEAQLTIIFMRVQVLKMWVSRRPID